MISCSSGNGDDIVSSSIASKIATLAQTRSLDEAARQVILEKAAKKPSACAVIAMDSAGHISVQSSARAFSTASCTPSESSVSAINTTTPLLSQHIFYQDSLMVAGLTRYPITPGHVVADCKTAALLSLNMTRFLSAMTTLRRMSVTVNAELHAHRCALSCDGSGLVSLLPLHGLSKDWKPVIHAEEEYHDIFPGYLTSKNGPKMSDAILDATQSRIAHVTGIKQPYNTQFVGDPADQNIFVRIIRGDLFQWRIWEDDAHVAFLTPFGNTPGYTVLVPRKHLGSDIFGLEDRDFAGIIRAAYTVAQYLKKAFSVERCGMFFEGYEIDYAHIKLVPVHAQKASEEKQSIPILGAAPFHDQYQGYLTTQLGSLASDLNVLSEYALKFKKLFANHTQIKAPKTWKHPTTHSLQALQSSWYPATFTLQDTLFQATNNFFHGELGYRYSLTPVTTDSISSPMGLGSDSLPVEVRLHSQNTYLADSMQFTLEYVPRLEEGIKGVYYVSTSFRGEDHDKMHLNQFYHAECELLGTLDDGIEIAERYVTTVAATLLKEHADTIRSIAGTTSHITDLLALYESNGGSFPRVTLKEALSFSQIASNPHAWEYAVPGDHSKGSALTRIGERILINNFGGVVWLTEMDHLSVPFYQAFAPGTDKSKALCADLLFGPGEVLGLGQRHADAEGVREALKMHEVPENAYQWYMDIRNGEIGGEELQTTGWGLGMERFLAWVLNHDDIRDMAIMPRLK